MNSLYSKRKILSQFNLPSQNTLQTKIRSQRNRRISSMPRTQREGPYEMIVATISTSRGYRASRPITCASLRPSPRAMDRRSAIPHRSPVGLLC